MSENESENSTPDSPEESGESPVERDEEMIPESELPTLPDVSPPGDDGAGNEGPDTCPNCGAAIPPEAPRGLCPKCVLAGAAVPTDVDSVAGGRSRSGPRFDPPEIETIAAAFPQLEIVELIGCGGMGAVYKARQPHLDRFVALKILPPSLAETPGFTERFTREGRLLAKLSHPAIVGVHDFGQAGGFFFLLMEYVDGVNLRQAMRAGRFTPEQALGIVPKVCEALQFAHDEGVLHRDIKPENILLDSKGVVKIADFGIAKLLDEAAEADPTLTGSMAPGTPHYMAPEQIEHPAEVDHRADIYSLGVVFYEMLTGELPIGRFAAPSEKVAVDSQIDEIVFRSLEKERDRRQQSAGEVKTEIEGLPVSAIAAERHPGYAIPAGDGETVAAGDPNLGRRPSGGRKAAILVLLAFLLPLFLNLGLLVAMTIQRGEEARQLAKFERAMTERKALLLERSEELRQLRNELNGASDQTERERIQGQIVTKNEEVKRYSSEPTDSRQTPVEVVTVERSWLGLWLPIGTLSLLWLVVLGVAIAGTAMGWKSLRRIRALELPEGKGLPMFAALFFPLLVMVLIVFGLVAFPMSLGPNWVAAVGVSTSLIVAAGLAVLAIRWTRRWLKKPATESERQSILSEFERPANPWPRRIVWLVLGLLALPLVLIGLYLAAAKNGSGMGLPGVIELVIVAGIFGFFIFLIWILVRGARVRSETAEARSAPAPVAKPVNPWPRRVFWLLILIFVVPVALIVIALAVPMLAHQKAPARNDTVRIVGHVEGEHSVSVQLDSRRYGNRNMSVAVVFEGPKLPEDSGGGDHESMFPGQSQEWNLFGDKQQRADKVTFVLPDRETAEMASRQVVQAFQHQEPDRHQGSRAGIGRIELFDVAAGESSSWRAWVEFRSGAVVDAGSPPVKELLVGDWRLSAGVAGEGEFADLIVSFAPDGNWSTRTRLMGAELISSGVWKLRGGGRLELETFESTTASDVGNSEHVTIESIDDSTLVIRGQAEDDPDELMTYRRVDLPAESTEDLDLP